MRRLFRSSPSDKQKTIYALDRETDARLWLLCVSMAFTGGLWIFNLSLSGVVFLNLFTAEYSFFNLFLYAYGIMTAALAIYSIKMLVNNTRHQLHFFKGLQRHVVVYEKHELYAYRFFILKQRLKERRNYWIVFIVSFVLLAFSVSYMIHGFWIEALFSTFCYGVVTVDRLMGCESLWFKQLLVQSQQRYAQY